jgi:hypothetical protein
VVFVFYPIACIDVGRATILAFHLFVSRVVDGSKLVKIKGWITDGVVLLTWIAFKVESARMIMPKPLLVRVLGGSSVY